jgi:hypothetical protein
MKNLHIHSKTVENARDTSGPIKIEYVDVVPNPSDGKPIKGHELHKYIAPPHTEPVPGLLPVGLTLVMGNSKSGLSNLTYHMAAQNSNGKPVFGSYNTPAKRVGYQALDQDSIRAAKTLKILVQDLDANLFNTVLIPGEKVFGYGHPIRVQGYIQRLKIGAFFIDPVIRAMGIKVAGRFHSEYHYLSLLSQVAHQNGVSIVVVYHSTKRELDENVFASKSLAAAADNILLLTERYDAQDVTYYTLQHYGRLFPKRTMFLKSEGSRYNLVEIDELPKVETDQEMDHKLEIMLMRGLTQVEMGQILGITQGQISKMIKEKGPVIQSADSVYLDDIGYFEPDGLDDSLESEEDEDEPESEDSDTTTGNADTPDEEEQDEPEK